MSDTDPGRPWIRAILGYAVLFLTPLLLALMVLGAKFQGLNLPLAQEHAQIARQVASGQGLTTNSIRPLSLAIRPEVAAHPDLYHAPAHPLLLGLAYAVVRPSDRLTGAVGLLLWAGSVLMTFFLARRWFGAGTAVVATTLYGCNTAMIRGAVFGLPYPLCAIFVLAGAWIMAPAPRGIDAAPEPEEKASALGIAAAGAACALAAMTHYLLFWLAIPAGLWMAASRQRRARAIFFFALGFFVVLLPWMIRNVRWAGSPFFSLYWYESLAGTDAWPGDTVWRARSAAATGPLEFLLLHPLQVFRKGAGNLVRFWQESIQVVDPVVGFLFVAALVSGAAAGPWRRWLLSVTAGALLCVAASCVLRPEPEILIAWTPLMAIAGAARLVEWLSDRAGQTSMRRWWDVKIVRSLFRQPEQARKSLQVAGALAVLGIAGFPLFHYLWIFRAEVSQAHQDGAALRSSVPENATVMTDQPGFVAWYGQRRSLWLCLKEEDWDSIENRGGKIGATYISHAVSSRLPRESAGWWWWIASPRGVYRDLAPVETMPPHGVLRVRAKERG